MGFVLALGASVPAIALLSSIGTGGGSVQVSAAHDPTPSATAAGPEYPVPADEAPTTSAPPLVATLGPDQAPVEVHRRITAVNGTRVPVGEAPGLRPDATVPPPVPADAVSGDRAAAVATTAPPTTSVKAKPSPVTASEPATPGPTTSVEAAAASPGATAAAPALAACGVDDVTVTVATDQTGYTPGNPVKGFTSIVNRSSGICLLAARHTVAIEDTSGRAIGDLVSTFGSGEPVPAEPGRTISTGFSWDQRDCSGATCVAAPAGAYTVVARWTSSVDYRPGRAKFTLKP